MKSQFVSFIAYPALLLMSYSVFNTTSSNTDSSTLDVTNDYVISSEAKVVGPIKLPTTEKPSIRDLSLATSGEDSFISFKEALAFKESRGQYWRVNSLGYLGKYQFGATTLKHFGVTDTEAFLNSVSLQERIFLKYLRYNHKSLKSYIEKYEGKTIAGVEVTESGILAAAHLSGPGGVRKFLKSNGNLSSKDAYGSSVRSYMKKFGGYDLSDVL